MSTCILELEQWPLSTLRAGKSLSTMPQFVAGIMDRIGLRFTHLNYLAKKGNSLQCYKKNSNISYDIGV
jgi:hypothetical protein